MLGDLGRQFPVAETGPGEAEVAVEGIDKDLEGGLPGLGLVALGRRGRRLGELLVLEAVLAQPTEHLDEDAEGIAPRVAVQVQQQARIERGDVKMQDVMEDALLEAAGEAALEGGHLDRGRAGGPGVVVFLEEKEVDLARGPAERGLLQLDGKRPRLFEISGQQHVGHALGLAEVVRQVGQESLPVGPKLILDPGTLDVSSARARLRGDPEIYGGILQSVAGHLASGDVVELDEQVGVDHRPAWQVAAREIHPALRHLEAAVAKLRRPTETAPFARELVALAALPEVIEVELEDVVPLDGVRIELPEQVIEGKQQADLAGIRLLSQHEQLATGAALQADREDPVGGLAGVAETTGLGRRRLDVELAAAQSGKGQAAVQSGPLLDQPLAFVRLKYVQRRAVPRRLEEILEGREGLGVGQPRKGALAGESLDRHPLVSGGLPQPGEGTESDGALLPAACGRGDRDMGLAIVIDPQTAERFGHRSELLRGGRRRLSRPPPARRPAQGN